MGYVVASCDYRLGWNPVATTQEERVNTLINAAYRGVQDCRTAVRFFRKSQAENGNPFGIDPWRIGVWGQGTGGYIAFAAATINAYAAISLLFRW
jgi:carboxylesterase type B